MKFILRLFLSAGLLFLGATVLQDTLITFAPYFGMTYDFTFIQILMFFILGSGVIQLFNAERLSEIMDRLNPRQEQSFEDILSKKLGVAVAMLLLWLEFWIVSLIIL